MLKLSNTPSEQIPATTLDVHVDGTCCPVNTRESARTQLSPEQVTPSKPQSTTCYTGNTALDYTAPAPGCDKASPNEGNTMVRTLVRKATLTTVGTAAVLAGLVSSLFLTAELQTAHLLPGPVAASAQTLQVSAHGVDVKLG